MTIATATYENCRWGEPVQVESIEVPPDRTTPEGVASYLRYGGRITDRVLKSFSWNGQRFDSMGSPTR